MKKVAITGLTGVLGTYLVEPISQKSQVIELFHTQPTNNPLVSNQHIYNLLDSESVTRALDATKPDCVVHLAAMTHIDSCQLDARHGKDGVVWKTNVGGTKSIVDWVAKNDAYLILASTEAIFDGTLQNYDESAAPNPISWYGETKAAAEKVVLDSHCRASIIRAVIAYAVDDNPNTFFGALKQPLQQNKKLTVVSDHFITPTYIPDITRVVNSLIDQELTGIFHLTPQKILTPLRFAEMIAAKYRYDSKLISEVTLEQYLGPTKAALRVKHACLNSTQTQKKLNTTFTEFEQALNSK